MRILLIDDEKPALEELEYILMTFEDIQLVGKYSDPIKGLEGVKKVKPDVVFLDISMPEMDGFMVAKEILKINDGVFIVFATAYDDYAIQAFDINAVDYVVKPLDEDRLNKTIKRIRKAIEKNNKDTNISNLVNKQINKLTKLAVWKNDRIILLEPSSILYCTVREGQSYIVTKDEEYHTSDTLSKLEEELERQNFFRCHRSYLINIEHIKEIIPWFNNTFVVKMKDSNEEVPISRRHLKDFKEIFHI